MSREVNAREALWIPAGRKFVLQRFGQECTNLAFDSVRQTPTIQHFKNILLYPKQGKKLHIVQGVTGCGKTLGAMLIMARSIGRTGVIGEYLRMTDLSQKFGRPGYTSQDKEEYRERLAEVPWIVVDDLGAEECSPRLAEEFFNLVDIWARRFITGIFITNEEPREVWPDRYGSRTWSRIQGWSRGEIYRSPDPDFRVHPEELENYPIGIERG